MSESAEGNDMNPLLCIKKTDIMEHSMTLIRNINVG
jgi:hypothetical protein